MAAPEKEMEVYIDFSKEEEEEEVIEEVQTTENDVVAGPFDKIIGMVPPQVAELLERAKESYDQHRNYYLIGLAIVVVILVVIAALFLLLIWSDSGPSFNYDSETFTHTLGPFILTPGINKFNVSMPHPEMDFSLHKINMRVMDLNDNIRIGTVYPRYMYITNQDNQIIGGAGPQVQVDPLLSLPSPYVMSVLSDEWTLHVRLDNLWGIEANAPIEVYILYELIYSTPDADKDTAVHWGSVGHFENVLSEGEIHVLKGSPTSYTKTSKWNSGSNGNNTLVAAVGHMAIGGVNMTLEDGTNGVVIATVTPVYDDESGFIVSIPAVYPDYVLVDGVDLKVTAHFNDDSYADPQYFFQLWGNFPGQNPFDSDGDSTPSHIPSATRTPASPSASFTGTVPSSSSTPSGSGSISGTPCPTPTSTVTPSPIPTSTDTPSISVTFSISVSPSPTPTDTFTGNRTRTS